MEEIVEKLKDVITQENEKLHQKIREEMKEANENLHQKIREEMKETIGKENGKLYQKIHEEMDDLRKEILDKQFLFENDYGTKIDAIFEYVQFHQENNLKRFDRISNLEKRVEVTEIHNFDHEKRISALERKKV